MESQSGSVERAQRKNVTEIWRKSNGANCVRDQIVNFDMFWTSLVLDETSGILMEFFQRFIIFSLFCVGTLKHLQHSQYKTLPLSHSTHFSSQIFRLVAEKMYVGILFLVFLNSFPLSICWVSKICSLKPNSCMQI